MWHVAHRQHPDPHGGANPDETKNAMHAPFDQQPQGPNDLTASKCNEMYTLQKSNIESEMANSAFSFMILPAN
jgi:hypothetical protein